MTTFPYTSSNGAISQLIEHLRKRFVGKVDSAMLKKLEIAPNNESYIINAFKFIKVLTAEGEPNSEVQNLFAQEEEEFKTGFADLVEAAYLPLFELHGESAWNLEKTKLVTFFRLEDKSTDLVGKRQADTFVRLAEIAGKREAASGSNDMARAKRDPIKKKIPKITNKIERENTPEVLTSDGNSLAKINDTNGSHGQNFSLAVRIEVNLPASADQATYDAIFKSIRENLIESE